MQLFKAISGVCSKNNGGYHVKKSFLAITGLLFMFLTLPSVARDSYEWVSYKKGFWCWWVYFGWWWVVVCGGGYILADGGWSWVVLDGGGWWYSLV